MRGIGFGTAACAFNQSMVDLSEGESLLLSQALDLTHPLRLGTSCGVESPAASQARSVDGLNPTVFATSPMPNGDSLPFGVAAISELGGR